MLSIDSIGPIEAAHTQMEDGSEWVSDSEQCFHGSVLSAFCNGLGYLGGLGSDRQGLWSIGIESFLYTLSLR
jgi:hypothetical protein